MQIPYILGLELQFSAYACLRFLSFLFLKFNFPPLSLRLPFLSGLLHIFSYFLYFCPSNFLILSFLFSPFSFFIHFTFVFIFINYLPSNSM